jgi:hypothetical protein
VTVAANRSAPGVRLVLLASERASGGTPVDLTGRIISFSYEDAESKADKVSLTLDNFDLSMFDRKELLAGALLEVSWGYPGNMAPPRRVVIKKLKGFTTLTIEGQALSVQLNQKVKTRGWTQKKRSDVVREIAAAYGFEGASLTLDDTAEVFDVINQCGETDAWFLRRLASRENFAFFVDDSGLHWHRRKQDAAPARVFTWYTDPGQGDVISVDAEANLAQQTGSVSVKTRDPIERKDVEAKANKDTVDRTTLSDVIEVPDPETRTTAMESRLATASVHPSAAGNEARAKREADARFLKSERAAVKLTMQVIGDPSLRAKTIVEVRGISTLLSGKYHVNEVKHAISGSGYTCDLKLTRDGRSGAGGGPGQPQGGSKNTAAPGKDGDMTEMEVPDPETRTTSTASYRNGQPIGAGDPEGRPGGGK